MKKPKGTETDQAARSAPDPEKTPGRNPPEPAQAWDASTRETQADDFQTLFDSLDDMLFILDSQGRILHVNKAVERRLGYLREELVGLPSIEVHPPELRARATEIIAEMVSGVGDMCSIPLLTKAGELIPVETGVARGTWRGQNVLIGVSRDISERKRRENVMRAQRDLMLASVGGPVDLQEMLSMSVATAIQVSEMDCGGIYLVDGVTGSLDLAFHKGLSDQFVDRTRHFGAESPNARLVMVGDPVYTRYGELGTPLDRVRRREGLRGSAIVPVRGNAQVVACLNVASHTHDEIPDFARNALEMTASQIGSLIVRSRVEHALRQSEQRYELATIAGKVGVWDWDLETNEIYIDPRLKAILGYKDHEIRNHLDDWGRFVHPDDVEQVMAKANAHLEGLTPHYEVVHRMIRKDDSVCWFLARGTAMRDADGRPYRVVGTDTDITERKKAEEALRESEQKYKSLFESAGDALFIMSVSNEQGARFADCNDSTLRLFGCATRDQIIGKGPEDFSPPTQPDGMSSRGKARELTSEVMQGHPHLFEWAHHRRDGTPFWVEVNLSRIELRGEFFMQAVVRDITARRQAEEALRESERMHRSAIEGAGAVPYFRNLETGGFDFMGQGIQELTGYSAGQITPDILDSTFVEALPIGPMSRMTTTEARALMRRDRAALWRAELRTITRTGEEKWLIDSAKGVYGDRGELVGTFGILLDITDRKRTEKEVQRAHNLESLGTLAGGIAHDFNNVLTGVTGNLALLERMLDKESVEYEIVAEARASADRTRNLTRQLMAFARGGAPVKEAASIEELIRETVGLSLSGSNTRPNYLFAEDLSPVDIDRGQIGQVIQNLVMNADQAMPNGGVLNVSAGDVNVSKGDPAPLEAGRYVKVTVEDQGIGMSEEVLERVFDPYYTTKPKGHGLGLSIAHTIISNHGGHITATSEVGEGTTFEFYVPASEKRAVEAPQQETEPASASGKILLMDDEETIHRTVGRMLEALGYEVALSSDGEEALQAYRAAMEAGDRYDLVIMDLTIPGGMGGRETVNRLHQIDPDARVVVASGYSNDPVMADPEGHGFVGIVKKPVDLDELAKTVKEAMA